MEWFRWHHGAVSDDKWPLIARKSGQSVAVVVAVWAALLECASQAENRGSIEDFDPESMDALLGLADGVCQAVIDALASGKKPRIMRGMIANWSKRQPLREREDSTSAERGRRYRERQKSAQDAAAETDNASAPSGNASPSPGNASASPGNASAPSGNASPTPGNASPTPAQDQETPRSDQIREEEKQEGGEGRARAHDATCAPERFEFPLSCAMPSEPGQMIGTGTGPKRTDCPTKGTPEWPAFNACFAVYPVKQGKEEAWREWMRLKENSTLAQAWEIRDAILRLSGEDSRWLRGKVPKMARWLQGKGWEDEPFIEPEPGAARARDRPPLARTQFQKGRQDMEDLAKFVLAADKELAHGNTAANHNGAGPHGPALPAADIAGGASGPGAELGEDMP